MPSWTYNEFRHIGVDFDDPQQVSAYEARQKTNLNGERKLVARLGISRNHTVLEFGSGTGAFAIAAGEVGAKVIGIDISQAMLLFATRKAKDAGLDSVEFRRGGYLSQEQPPGCFDYVVTKFTIHHLPDFWKVEALRRIRSCLAPNGTLYVQDVVFSFEPNVYDLEIEAWIERATNDSSFSRSDFEMHVRDEFSTYGVLMERILHLAGFKIETANYYSKVQAEYICR